MRTFATILILCIFRFSATAEQAEEFVSPAHSGHGEAFNEGPRQAAYLMEGMPNVTFPVTTSNETAQAFFNQGVAQLHGFWYFEAERSFRQVMALDTNCTMALWGITMANVDNLARATKLIKDADKKMDHLSEREKLYLKSLVDFYKVEEKKTRDDKQRRRQLVRAYEKIVHDFPDDLEARAFLVFQIWHNSSRGKMELMSHEAVSALADAVLAVDPMHPLHHYRIHLWDTEKKERGLDAAAKLGPSGPGIAHMWHMPGHIYSGLKRYVDAAWQQEASARVDHAHMMRDHIMPERIHNYAHNNGWLSDNLAHVGRVNDAVALQKNMIELPRMPKFNDEGVWRRERSGFDTGQRRLLKTLVTFELWEEVLAADAKGYFMTLDDPAAELRRHHALARAHFGLGKKAEGIEALRKLRGLQGAARKARYVAADEAEKKAIADKKKPDEVTAAMTAALQSYGKRLREVKQRITEVEVVRDLHKKTMPDGLVKRVESMPGVSKSAKALFLMHLAEYEKAEKAAADGVKQGKGQVLPLIVQIEVLQHAGKVDEAKKALGELQKMSAFIDADLPAMKRIVGLMDKGVEDWRTAHVAADDVGARPPLDSLGPFRWSPYTAPTWTMKDAEGKPVRLEDYKGKPVLLIYYLGSGCRHCIEQLDAFAKVAKQYDEKGLSIVAVSRESVADLGKTREAVAKDEWFPFTILSDESLVNFKAYRAFDDFEDLALHGTYLIDGEGRVRWQDIGFEPFMQPEFLLEEAQRLLMF